jgi:hypothetical protein
MAGPYVTPGTYPKPYPDEAPPAPPSNKQPDYPPTPLFHLDTEYLKSAQKALRSNIPSDPTFMAHVGAILRAIIQHDIANPDRIERDEAELEARTKLARETDEKALAERHEAELAAMPEDKRPEIEAKQKAELEALDRKRAADDLVAKQAEERKEFEERQKVERDKLVAA